MEEVLENTVETNRYSRIQSKENDQYIRQRVDENREELGRCGLLFDSEGNPLWYESKEVFGELAEKLLKHYGESIRQPLNESLAAHGLPKLRPR